MKKSLFLLFLALTLSNLKAQNDSVFSKLSLNDAIQEAIKNHPEVNKARYNVESLEGKYYKDITLPQPEISVGYDWIPSGKGLSNYGERGIEISQKFDFPTLYLLKGAKSSAEINGANSGLNFSIISTIADVKKSYYNAYANFQLLKIAEESYKISEEFIKKAEIRFNVGEGSNLELLTAKNQFSEAKANIETARKEYLNSLSTLNFKIGNKGNELDKVRLTDSMPFIEYNFKLEELLAKSYESNPSLKKARYILESAELNKSIAWSGLIPNFNLSYSNQAQNGISNYYGVRFGMSFPLWFFLDQRGQIQENNANYNIALNELRTEINSITVNIKKSIEEFNNDNSQVKLYKNELLPQAEEIFRIATISYQSGEITYLEFLQAKITYINTQSNFVWMLYDYNTNLINLEEAVGASIF